MPYTPLPDNPTAAAPALTAVMQEQFSYTRVKAEEALKQISGEPAAQGADKLE